MTSSVLQFAKQFGRLRSNLGDAPSDDVRLLLLLHFWDNLKPHIGHQQYSSYAGEYTSWLESVVTTDNLYDFTISEHTLLQDILEQVGLATIMPVVARSRITIHCYVGDLETAVDLCSQLFKEHIDQGSCEEVEKFFPERLQLKAVSETLRIIAPQSSKLLKSILEEWEEKRELLYHDRAHCLFVESGRLIPSPRGRLRFLQGTVESRKSRIVSGNDVQDEVSYDNRNPDRDDPALKTIYDALHAIRPVLREYGTTASTVSTQLSARFRVLDTNHILAGDSIGLAAGVVAFTQLLQPELLRHERFVANDVAFTGGLSSSGKVVAVNDETIQLKVERAFFSPIKFLVVPQENAGSASDRLNELIKQYPRRKLHIVSADSFGDLIENRNIVCAEKVCIGQFVARRAYKYSRATKVQVPLLVVMLYALISILYPKAWIGFDWNPQYVTLTDKGFAALNRDSTILWEIDHECGPLQSAKWVVQNIDDDARNEVCIFSVPPRSVDCDSHSLLIAYDDDGDVVFEGPVFVKGEYPGDDGIYSPWPIRIFERNGRKTIAVTATRDSPSRAHITYWNTSGQLLGWYINAGTASFDDRIFCGELPEGDVFAGLNRRMRCVCLFVLPRTSSLGVSPPYQDPYYDLESCRRGNQVHYILLPATDLAKAHKMITNHPRLLIRENDSTFIVQTQETPIPGAGIGVRYHFDRNFRLVTAEIEDSFVEARERAFKSLGLQPVEWIDYTTQLINAVTYWSDSGWVTEGQLRAAE